MTLNSKVKLQTEIQKHLIKFKQMNDLLDIRTDLYYALSCLFGSLEQQLIQSKSNRFNVLIILRQIFNNIFYKYSASNLSLNNHIIYLWPIQFLHVDFIVLLADELKIKSVPYRIIVMRDNLVPYVQAMGHNVTLVEIDRNRRSFRKMILECSTTFKYIRKIVLLQTTWQVKKAYLHVLNSLSQPLVAKAATQQVMKQGLKQYHMVGYDLSAMGISIIQQAKLNGMRTGRIQNGAPNYNLSGYSKVDELFLWDQVSADAYLKNGFKGELNITGNILLQATIKNGFDEIWKQTLHAKLIHQYQIKFMVAFSGPGHNTTIQGHIGSLNELFRLCTHFNNILFLIKLHPKDDLKYYPPFQYLPNVLFTDTLPHKPDALNLLNTCNGLITGASSVALDAMQMNKPIVSIDPLKELLHFNFLTSKNVLNTNQYSDSNKLYLAIEQHILTNQTHHQSTTNVNGLSIILNNIKKIIK